MWRPRMSPFDSSRARRSKTSARCCVRCCHARNQFEVSAAEVGSQDIWNLAEIGVACVSGESAHALDVIEEVIRSMERARPDIEITQATTDVTTIE